jgi:hypothetical protein
MGQSCRIVLVAFLFALTDHFTFAQYPYSWMPIDTLTAGDFDDAHPSVVHNSGPFGGSYDNSWVVFERQIGELTKIVAKRYVVQRGAWDSADYVISTTSSAYPQRLPDIAETQYWDTTSHIFRVAVWQRWDGGHWQIVSSVEKDTSVVWAQPSALTDDTVDNTSAQVRGLRDSTFLLLWRRGDMLVSSILTPTGMGPIDTLGMPGSSNFAYDVASMWGQFTVLWTLDSSRVVERSLSAYQPLSWSDPETLAVGMAFTRPHLIVALTPPGTFFCDAPIGNGSGIFLALHWGNGTVEVDTISGDSLSTERNAGAFSLPIVTKRNPAKPTQYVYFDVLVFERATPNDSALVFFSWSMKDTVHSAGHNRDAVIGSELRWNYTPSTLVVWESNRTGRSHIYGRWVRVSLGDVPQAPTQPAQVVLYQNYPNPFNPETVISGQLTVDSWMRLEVFDLLGRKLTTLVDGKVRAGTFSYTFDGTGWASGMYFYRLEAGDNVLVRKMVLLK